MGRGSRLLGRKINMIVRPATQVAGTMEFDSYGAIACFAALSSLTISIRAIVVLAQLLLDHGKNPLHEREAVRTESASDVVVGDDAARAVALDWRRFQISGLLRSCP